MVWLFFALLAPFLFAIGNILDKLLREKHLGTFTLSIASGLVGFWVLALVPFVNVPFSVPALAAGLTTGVLFFANAFPYFKALSIEEASRVIPLWAFEAPIVLVLAFAFLNERLQLNDYVGFILVVAGAFLILTRKLSDILKPSKAFFLMLLAASLTSTGIAISKWLYSQMSFWAVQVLIGLGMGSAALVSLLIFAKKRRELFAEMLKLRKSTVSQLALRGLAITAAVLVFGLAIMTGSASLSAALVQLSAFYVLVIATILSRFLPHILKEEINKKALLTKAVAIVMIVAGVFAINL